MTVVVYMKNGETLRFSKSTLHIQGNTVIVGASDDHHIRLAIAPGEWITAKEEPAP